VADEETLIDWIDKKHRMVAKVIPVASSDPWTLHGEENICIGCLSMFVTEYLADVPEVMTEQKARELIAAGLLDEEFE